MSWAHSSCLLTRSCDKIQSLLLDVLIFHQILRNVATSYCCWFNFDLMIIITSLRWRWWKFFKLRGDYSLWEWGHFYLLVIKATLVIRLRSFMRGWSKILVLYIASRCFWELKLQCLLIQWLLLLLLLLLHDLR